MVSTKRSRIEPCNLPDGALLMVYADDEKSYTDCYTTQLTCTVALADYVSAFYTTRLFKVERAILRIVASRPSTDDQAKALALGHAERFAAWHVEERTETQLLMCDFAGRTRSWFMVEPKSSTAGTTRLYFGSAVVAAENKKTGTRSLGWIFNALLGFHKLYSRALLSAARSRLDAQITG